MTAAGLPPTGPPSPVAPQVSGAVQIIPPQPGQPALAALTLGQGAIRCQVALDAGSAVEFLRGLTEQAIQVAQVAAGMNGTGILPVSGDAMSRLPSVLDMVERSKRGPLHGPNGGR